MSYDKTARLWTVADGAPGAVLQGHKNEVFAVAFARDGKTLATASYDKLVKLWDLTGRSPGKSPPSRATAPRYARWPFRPTARVWPRAAATGR